MTDGTAEPTKTAAGASATPSPPATSPLPYSPAALVGLMDELTPQQQNVARLIGACFTVKQTMAILGITKQVVHEHIEKIVYTWDLDPTKDARSQIALVVATVAALKAMQQPGEPKTA